MPRVLFESALIVFSVLLALALDEWRQERRRAERSAVALQAIRAELAANRAALQRAFENHDAMHDSLTAYAARGAVPPPRIYDGGMFNPGRVLSDAWESAKESGATDPLPYELHLMLSRVYGEQERYQALGDAIVQSTYADVRRRGGEAVFRDGYEHFSMLARDFANREQVLGTLLDSAVVTLGSAR